MGSVTGVQGQISVNAITGASIGSANRSHFFRSGVGAALLANLLWGTSFLASKYTLTAWGPFTASALRFGFATALMFVGLKLFGRTIRLPRSGSEWLGTLAVSITGFGFLYPLQLTGLTYISSGMSAAIMLTSPLFVVLAGRLFLAEKFTSQKIVGIALGILGGVGLLLQKGTLTVTGSHAFILGSSLTIAASLSLALSVIATRKLTKSLDSGSLTFCSMGIGFVLLSSSAWIFEKQNVFTAILSGTISSWTALIFLAVICSAFCFFIWNYALSKATPREIASTMHIKTPTAVLLGVVLASEAISLQLVVATAVVMLGVWLSQTAPTGTRK